MNSEFFYSKNDTVTSNSKSSIIKERLSLVTSHMYKQYCEHTDSAKNTNKVFSDMLKTMEEVVATMKKNFEEKGINPNNISCTIDADKSVGILNILWHSISFTTRGNTKPQALYRSDNAPMFCGRIIALNGDFKNASMDISDLQYPGVLSCEMASMYVPSDPNKDAVMKIRHIGNIEYKINQSNAAREFLLKVIEIICGGGFYHEENFE
ncbi:MAG: hypothetical protein PHX18_05230 [Candidatus Gastranaerophilales bacterium]|nr:hypothetical protein [Candidatus Gastranaerophilales bacterium]